LSTFNSASADTGITVPSAVTTASIFYTEGCVTNV